MKRKVLSNLDIVNHNKKVQKKEIYSQIAKVLLPINHINIEIINEGETFREYKLTVYVKGLSINNFYFTVEIQPIDDESDVIFMYGNRNLETFKYENVIGYSFEDILENLENLENEQLWNLPPFIDFDDEYLHIIGTESENTFSLNRTNLANILRQYKKLFEWILK